jgi:hypothetical protein
MKALSFTPLRWNLKKMTLIKYGLFDYFASHHVEVSSPVYAVQRMALNIFRQAEKLSLEKTLIATSLHATRR